jgi:hypothetical protein
VIDNRRPRRLVANTHLGFSSSPQDRQMYDWTLLEDLLASWEAIVRHSAVFEALMLVASQI